MGGNGRIYEGRGWTKAGAHTLHYNKISLGICLMGDFRCMCMCININLIICIMIFICTSIHFVTNILQPYMNLVHLPPKIQMDATQRLIQYGVDHGHISESYELYGHRDVRKGFDSPGEYLYHEICTWPHKAEPKVLQ